MAEKKRVGAWYIKTRNKKMIKELAVRLGLSESIIVDKLFDMADNGIQKKLIKELAQEVIEKHKALLQPEV